MKLSPIEFAQHILETDPEFATKELKDIDVTILQSTDTAKTRNLKDRITVEPARKDIGTREPEKTTKSTKEIESDLNATIEAVDSMPTTNKKNLAKEAIKREWIRTPEQLAHFLDQYEAIYQGIPGKTGLSKNRKFMNRFAEENIEKREIQPVDDKPIIDIKPTPERKLEMARTEKRAAKYEDNKAKRKQAQKKIDLAKRRIKQPKDQTPEIEPVKEAIALEAEPEVDMPIPEKPVEQKSDVGIVEETGKSAKEMLQPEPTLIGKVKETAKKAVETLSDPRQLAQDINTGLYDALAPLRKAEKNVPVEEQVTTRVKQAQSAASEINGVLMNGIFDNTTGKFVSGSLKEAYEGDGLLWKKFTKGLKDHEYSVEDMNIYRHSVEALKRQKRGFESGIDTKLAEEDVARLKQKYGPVYQRIHEYQKGVTNYYGKNTLTPEMRQQWTNEAHTSLYRAMDYGSDAVCRQGSLKPQKWWHKITGSKRKHLPASENDALNTAMLVRNHRNNESILQYKKNVEAGLVEGKIVRSKNKPVPEGFIKDLEINPENEALAETLYNQSRKNAFTTETGRLRGWEDGKPFEIEVPKEIYDVFSSIPDTQFNIAERVMGRAAQMLSRNVVFEPFKSVSITTRDALNSLVYSKTGINPISIVKAFRDVRGNSDTYKQFQAMGGNQYAARMMSRMDRITSHDKMLQIESPNVIIKPFKKMIDVLNQFGSDLSISVPFAEYQRALKVFGDTPEGRMRAVIEAKLVTNDPTTRGSNRIVRGYINQSSFAGPMIQEPGMIARNVKRPAF